MPDPRPFPQAKTAPGPRPLQPTDEITENTRLSRRFHPHSIPMKISPFPPPPPHPSLAVAAPPATTRSARPPPATFPMIGKLFSNGWKTPPIFSNDWKKTFQWLEKFFHPSRPPKKPPPDPSREIMEKPHIFHRFTPIIPPMNTQAPRGLAGAVRSPASEVKTRSRGSATLPVRSPRGRDALLRVLKRFKEFRRSPATSLSHGRDEARPSRNRISCAALPGDVPGGRAVLCHGLTARRNRGDRNGRPRRHRYGSQSRPC